MKPHPLKVAREARGWSQSKLAKTLGVNTRTVGRWELRLVVPHPHYREQLSLLFGRTIEELGLLEEVDNNDLVQEKVPPFIDMLTMPDLVEQKEYLLDSVIDKMSESANSLLGCNGSLTQVKQCLFEGKSVVLTAEDVDDVEVHEEDRYTARHNRFSYPSVRDVGIRYHMRHVSAFRLFNCSSQSSWFIVSMIVLAALVIISVSQAFNGRSFLQKQPYASLSPTSTSLIANYRPPLYGLTIQNADPSMLKTAHNLNQVFNAVYPQLVNRFALDPTTAPKTVTLTFASNLSSVASINGATIILSADWLQQHPNDFGLLTHELTVLLEHYPSGASGWFADGIADYARDVYGPANDDGWSLPDGVQPQDSYLQGGGIAARFLLWLEQHTTLSIVDQLNHALQGGQTFSTVFHRITHHSVDQLWQRYHSHPQLSLTPELLYTTVTSRKPLSQISSFNLQISQPRTFVFYTIPGIFVSNFALQADITTIQGDGGGFIFRWNNIQDNAGDSQYRIRIRPNVDKTLGNFDLAGANSVLTSTYSSAIKRGYNQTNQLTIIAQKHSLYFYVNGQFITQVDNNLSSDGIVAAMANDDSNPADVRFENIRVF